MARLWDQEDRHAIAHLNAEIRGQPEVSHAGLSPAYLLNGGGSKVSHLGLCSRNPGRNNPKKATVERMPQQPD